MKDISKAAQNGAGVHWFVAWRYLLARPRGLSGPILAVTALCLWVLMGFGMGIMWYPLADSLISPFAVMPWWLLIGLGLSIALIVVWVAVIGVRFVIYSEAGGPVQRALRWGFPAGIVVGALLFAVSPTSTNAVSGLVVWLVVAAIAGAMSRHPRDAAPSMLVVPIIGGLAALALFGVFDYFHRPYGAAGPEPLSTLRLVVFGGLLIQLIISAPLVTASIARRALIRDGQSIDPLPASWLRAIPALIGRYGVWGFLGIDIGLVALLLVGAGYGLTEVVWPARVAAPAGTFLWLVGAVGLLLGTIGLGVTMALWRQRIAAIVLRVSLLLVIVALFALVIIGVFYVLGLAYSDLPVATRQGAVKLPLEVNIPMLVAGALLAPTILLAAIRYFFTFFSTVSIGGVAIGTMALVIVLSVMSGFETDLRRKILGSNAHILVTKASDDPMICKVLPELTWQRCVIEVDHAFTRYREVSAEIEKTPGVIASSPYLISEVVIAANNNYANVIIKGVEPETVGDVSELDDNIEGAGGGLGDPELLVNGLVIDVGGEPLRIDAETVRRVIEQFGGEVDKIGRRHSPLEKLWPLSEDGEVIGKPKTAGAAIAPPIDPPAAGTDPAPPDFGAPTGVEPIDLSGGDDPDKPPDDLVLPDELPTDLSGPPPDLTDAGPDDIQLLPPDFDDPDLDPDDFGPGLPIGREGLSDAAREFTATIPPRVAILPGVLVGRELVKQINLYDGQEVKVVSPLGQDTPLGPVPRTKPFRVAGVFFTGMYEYDLKFIYVEVGALQDFLDLGDEVTGIEIRVVDPTTTDDVVAALAERLGPAFEVQDWKSLNRSLFSALKLEKIAMFLVLAIIILVASFSIVGNLIMVVVEKAREIAVIKTLGASDTGVMKIFVTQGFFIGLVGTGVGVSLGLLACWAGIRFGLPLDPDVYYIDKLPIHVDPTSVALVAASGIIISVVATLYPAYIAARLRPIRGLRYE